MEFELIGAIEESIYYWYYWYIALSIVHYSVGIVGLLAAALVASGATFFGARGTAIAGIVSAVCIGVVGFVQPGSNANLFFAGYAELRKAMVKYELDKAVDNSKSPTGPL